MKSLILFLLTVAPVLADQNLFIPIRERYQWAIEQLMEHRKPTDWSQVEVADKKGELKRLKEIVQATAVPFQPKTFTFVAETDKAKVNVMVTTLDGNFIIDVSADQSIQGWILKRQSTRQVFLKGGAGDNPYQTRIRVDRPYVADFGLTVFVSEDSDPAFVRLF